jgi:hypothetical protein
VIAAVECEGAPRDLGRDQGLACGSRLRARFDALPRRERVRLRLGLLRGPAARVWREMLRHFPRQAEALAGIAAGAGVPAAWLAACLEREGEDAQVEFAVAAGPDRAEARALVARVVAGEWIVRRSRPEGAFRSVEVARPWLAHALLGVNEAGLAAALVGGGSGGAELPAAPLVQDCLQRFATVEGCLEWCAGRPGSGPAALLLADARGEIAGVELAPGRRRMLRAADGRLLAGAASLGAAPTVCRRATLAPAATACLAPGVMLAWADPSTPELRLGADRYAC